MKNEIIDLLNKKKADKITSVTAAVTSDYDELIAEVQKMEDAAPAELPEGTPSELQLKVAELEKSIADKQAAFDADEIEDEAALKSAKDEQAKLQSKIDAVKSALEA